MLCDPWLYTGSLSPGGSSLYLRISFPAAFVHLPRGHHVSHLVLAALAGCNVKGIP